ncbi:DNA topoisomerase 3-alpha, partial [Bienertia sinuspersici]
MASQQSHLSGCSSRSRGSLSQVRCYHNEIAPLRSVKHNGPAMGKRFYGCAYWPQQTCGFFKWADHPDEVRELQMLVFGKDTIIAQLEMEKELLENKVKELKEKKAVLQDQVEELSIENNETHLAMCTTRADKRVLAALALSWVFFALVM